MTRWLWIAFGGAAQLLFVATVPPLFLLLYAGGGDVLGIEPVGWRPEVQGSLAASLALDLVLLAQFGVSHSLLLHRAVRGRVTRLVPGPLYGALFTVGTCVSVLLAAWFWRPLPGVVWRTDGVLGWVILAAFLGSWLLVFYSVSLTGAGWQTGLTPWWAYLRGRPVPTRPFATGNLYGWLRHPIYLGFLGLLWSVPVMTTDRLLLAVVWSIYVYVGSVLKDRRLHHYLGQRYRTYAERIPGYPLIPAGPLARWPKAA